MREFRSRGSVRGAVGNDRPYREHSGASCEASRVRDAPTTSLRPTVHWPTLIMLTTVVISSKALL